MPSSPSRPVATPARGSEPFAALFESWKTKIVRVEWSDLHGLARGHRLALSRFLDGWRDGFGFSSAAMEMDLQGETTRADSPEKRHGWPTFHALPLPETLLRFPLEASTAQVLAEPQMVDGSPVAFAPRTALRRILQTLLARGYSLRVGMEFEFYLLNAKGEPLGPGRQAYRTRCGPEEDGFREDLQGLLGAMGFDIETAILEDGPGQFEITMKAGAPLVVADSAFRVKNLIKEAATKRGLLATFISKPLTHEAGSGLHLHQQLCDLDGRSLFHDPDAPHGMSALMRDWLSGQLALMAPACAFYLPTVNAYKRLRTRGQGPISATWGIDNRTAAARTLGKGDSLRFENRVPGGEANPYLVIAAAIAGGMYGLEESPPLPPMLEGSAYDHERDAETAILPNSLRDSLAALCDSRELTERLGPELVERFVALKQGEEDRYERTVTDWERAEYFEYL